MGKTSQQYILTINDRNRRWQQAARGLDQVYSGAGSAPAVFRVRQ